MKNPHKLFYWLLLPLLLAGLPKAGFCDPGKKLSKSEPSVAASIQPGDVVFQAFPVSELTLAIEGTTESPFSHCGLVCERDGKLYVIEAVGPVQETPLARWIARGRQSGVAVFRLKAEFQAIIPEWIEAARSYAGLPYDIRFDFDDEKLYCSELVWKAYKQVTNRELGVPQRLQELKWKPFEAFIRKLENGGLPLDRKMITPRALSEANQLELVLRENI